MFAILKSSGGYFFIGIYMESMKQENQEQQNVQDSASSSKIPLTTLTAINPREDEFVMHFQMDIKAEKSELSSYDIFFDTTGACISLLEDGYQSTINTMLKNDAFMLNYLQCLDHVTQNSQGTYALKEGVMLDAMDRAYLNEHIVKKQKEYTIRACLYNQNVMIFNKQTEDLQTSSRVASKTLEVFDTCYYVPEVRDAITDEALAQTTEQPLSLAILQNGITQRQVTLHQKNAQAVFTSAPSKKDRVSSSLFDAPPPEALSERSQQHKTLITHIGNALYEHHFHKKIAQITLNELTPCTDNQWHLRHIQEDLEKERQALTTEYERFLTETTEAQYRQDEQCMQALKDIIQNDPQIQKHASNTQLDSVPLQRTEFGWSVIPNGKELSNEEMSINLHLMHNESRYIKQYVAQKRDEYIIRASLYNQNVALFNKACAAPQSIARDQVLSDLQHTYYDVATRERIVKHLVKFSNTTSASKLSKENFSEGAFNALKKSSVWSRNMTQQHHLQTYPTSIGSVINNIVQWFNKIFKPDASTDDAQSIRTRSL
jgi:hypothetical protein